MPSERLEVDHVYNNYIFVNSIENTCVVTTTEHVYGRSEVTQNYGLTINNTQKSP